MDRKLWCTGLVWALVFGAVASVSAQNKSEKSAGSGATSPLAGLGSISGTVKAPKEFKAAKVYVKNVDKNVVYMVFTDGGRYQAVDLFPGNYEVSVTKNGFTGSDVQKITIASGGSATADFTLKEGTYRPNQQMRSGLPKDEPLVSYDELYPPGHARETIERTCIMCHGPDFLPNKQWDESQWNAAIDLMQNPNDNAGARLVPGTFAPGEREELVAYLVKNFGPDSKKRGLAVPDEPIDEKALGKAMFIEYHIPPLAKGRSRIPRRAPEPEWRYLVRRRARFASRQNGSAHCHLDRLRGWRPTISRARTDAGCERRHLDGRAHGLRASR